MHPKVSPPRLPSQARSHPRRVVGAIRAGIRQLRLNRALAAGPWLAGTWFRPGAADVVAVQLAHHVAPAKADVGAVFDETEVLLGSPEFRELVS